MLSTWLLKEAGRTGRGNGGQHTHQRCHSNTLLTFSQHRNSAQILDVYYCRSTAIGNISRQLPSELINIEMAEPHYYSFMFLQTVLANPHNGTLCCFATFTPSRVFHLRLTTDSKHHTRRSRYELFLATRYWRSIVLTLIVCIPWFARYSKPKKREP